MIPTYPPSEVLALFQNWMDNPNDVELSISQITDNLVTRDDISIKGLDPAIELTYYRQTKGGRHLQKAETEILSKKTKAVVLHFTKKLANQTLTIQRLIFS